MTLVTIADLDIPLGCFRVTIHRRLTISDLYGWRRHKKTILAKFKSWSQSQARIVREIGRMLVSGRGGVEAFSFDRLQEILLTSLNFALKTLGGESLSHTKAWYGSPSSLSHTKYTVTNPCRRRKYKRKHQFRRLGISWCVVKTSQYA